MVDIARSLPEHSIGSSYGLADRLCASTYLRGSQVGRLLFSGKVEEHIPREM